MQGSSPWCSIVMLSSTLPLKLALRRGVASPPLQTLLLAPAAPRLPPPTPLLLLWCWCRAAPLTGSQSVFTLLSVLLVMVTVVVGKGAVEACGSALFPRSCDLPSVSPLVKNPPPPPVVAFPAVDANPDGWESVRRALILASVLVAVFCSADGTTAAAAAPPAATPSPGIE